MRDYDRSEVILWTYPSTSCPKRTCSRALQHRRESLQQSCGHDQFCQRKIVFHLCVMLFRYLPRSECLRSFWGASVFFCLPNIGPSIWIPVLLCSWKCCSFRLWSMVGQKWYKHPHYPFWLIKSIILKGISLFATLHGSPNSQLCRHFLHVCIFVRGIYRSF